MIRATPGAVLTTFPADITIDVDHSSDSALGHKLRVEAFTTPALTTRLFSVLLSVDPFADAAGRDYLLSQITAITSGTPYLSRRSS